MADTQTQSRRILGIPDEFWIGFVIMIGLFLKLVYDVTTGINVSTHDMGAWREMVNGMPNAGHLGVIQYYYTFHKMPTFDVATLSCYSNPPLFYAVCALLMQIFHDGFGWAVGATLHFLQCVNAIYVMVGLFAGFGIISKFGVRGRKFIASILFLTFFPAFYNIGATLNNDAMCYMNMMLCMNCALGWYQTRRKKTIIFTAVWLGLAMMSKLNAVIIAPAIAALFLCALFYDKRTKIEELRNQFIWFFSICIPLGMFWPVRNLIRFGTPLFYVQSISDEWQQLEGKYTFLQRIGLPDMASLLHLHLTTDANLEYNIWSQTFKSAIVDEQAISFSLTGTYVLTVILLFLTIILCILMHVMMVKALIGKRMQFEHKIFLSVGYLCVLGSYLRFCFSYPVVCTMNFRYIPTILIFPLAGAGLCGYGTNQDTTFERISSSAMNWLILAISFLSAFLFGFYPAIPA